MPLANMTNVPLKIIFFVHLVLTTLGCQGSWSPDSYLLYNLLFLGTILWTIHHKDSEEPVIMATCTDVIAFLLDAITLAVYFPSCDHCPGERFSASMAIINMIGRPISCLMLYKAFQERDGNLAALGIGGNFGDILGSTTRSPYEDIDRPAMAQGLSQDSGSPTHFFEGSGNLPDNKSPPPYQGLS